jgi:hypothetical protein
MYAKEIRHVGMGWFEKLKIGCATGIRESCNENYDLNEGEEATSGVLLASQ